MDLEGTKWLVDRNSVDPSEVPSYIDVVKRICDALKFYHDHNTNYDKYSYSLQGFWRQLIDYGEITLVDVGITVLGAVAWTLVRYFLTWTMFAPFAKSMKMKPNDTKKLPESLWKVIVYCILWGLSTFILFGSGHHSDIFTHPLGIWEDWHPGMSMCRAIYILYMAQLSFYLHSVYGTLFMDEWRKDSPIMIFHHFLTMSLIGFSYIMRYHKVGVLVLFVHDITDILLEFTKCNVYLKNRNGKYYPFHDHLSTVGFACFALAWYVFRLYWYPLKVLYSCAYGPMVFAPMGNNTPTFMAFNGMLIILQILNIYWFTYIVVFLFNVLTGRMKDIEDVRELDVDDKIKSGKTNMDGVLPDSNGANFTPRRSTRNKDKKRD